MKTFKVKAEMVVTYVYEVEAETFEDAIFQVEDGEADNCVETDSSSPRAVEYTIPGQMGWNTYVQD